MRAGGQDFGTGDVLIQAGVRLNARHIGLIAAANHPWVTVHRRPVVAIMATGDEIALPGEPIPPGGIVSSNSHALATLVTAVGGEPMVLPVAPDDRAAIADASDAAAKADMLVTAGGASVGEHDLVQDALRDRGLTLDFWKIAMRPGKPLMFGRLGKIPLLGLPGNPVSSLITAILFLAPAIGRLSGLANEPLPVTQAAAGRAAKGQRPSRRPSARQAGHRGGWQRDRDRLHPPGFRHAAPAGRCRCADPARPQRTGAGSRRHRVHHPAGYVRNLTVTAASRA